MAQKVMNQGMALPAPNSRFTAAVAMSPPDSMSVGDVRAPSTPLTNLEKPYAIGNRLVRLPTCARSQYPFKPFRLRFTAYWSVGFLRRRGAAQAPVGEGYLGRGVGL